ncbi:MAG: hypothetical protein ACI85Q_002331, partial [Salibacteraceae bacterium]
SSSTETLPLTKKKYLVNRLFLPAKSIINRKKRLCLYLGNCFGAGGRSEE